MYTQIRESLALRSLSDRGIRSMVGRTVVLLGLTSMFTDISSEMVGAVLPLYLVLVLHLAPVEFGIIDGLYQGGSAVVRVGAGMLSDRLNKHKQVAIAGYALSAASRLLLPWVGAAWSGVAAAVLLDRTGKGIRTGPRDAMISLSVPRAALGTAFGVHRSLDTLGALAGPLVAFGILLLTPGVFNSVFVISFLFGVVGLGILVLLVRAPASATTHTIQPQRWQAMIQDRRLRLLLVAATVLSAVTVSDAFVYLALQRRIGFQPSQIPLLYALTSVVFMLLAVPAGRLADAIGRGPVVLAGFGLLVPIYILLALPAPPAPILLATLALFGGFFAATDGVVPAIGSDLLDERVRAGGLAMLSTGTAIARIAASIGFGALWSLWGLSGAATVFAVALVGAIALTAPVLMRYRPGR